MASRALPAVPRVLVSKRHLARGQDADHWAGLESVPLYIVVLNFSTQIRDTVLQWLHHANTVRAVAVLPFADAREFNIRRWNHEGCPRRSCSTARP